MNPSARIAIAALFFLIAVPCPQGHCAKEETAHMTFKTTAISKDRTNTHVVKKGEWLMDILRKRLPNIEHRFTILRQFNPHLKDLDRILPGQKLILPALEAAGYDHNFDPAHFVPGQPAPESVVPDWRELKVDESRKLQSLYLLNGRKSG